MKTFRFSLVLFCLFIINGFLKAQYPTDYSFESYKIKDGLTEGGTYSVFQDHLGYIYAGTIGLERFDGYSFKNFRSNVLDKNTISIGKKNVIKEDAAGNLWVASEGFLSKYNQRKDTWLNFQYKKLGADIADFFIDNISNEVYITNKENVIYLLEQQTNTWKQFLVGGSNLPNTASNYKLNKIILVDSNNLLISTNNGLILFNKKTKSFTRNYLSVANAEKAIQFNQFTQKDANHWYVSSSNGVYLFSLKEGLTVAFQNSNGNDNTIMSNNISSIHYDAKKQDLWLSSNEIGIDIVHLKNNSITHLNKSNYNDKDVIKYRVHKIIQDQQDNIWMATDDGIIKYNPTRKEIKTISDKEPFDLKLPFTRTWGAFIDDQHHLWVGGSEYNNDGIVEIDLKNKKLTPYLFEKGKGFTNIWVIKSDIKNSIWAYRATLVPGRGIDIFKKEKSQKAFEFVGNEFDLIKDKKAIFSLGQQYQTQNGVTIFGGKPAMQLLDSAGKVFIIPFKPLITLKDQVIHAYFSSEKNSTYILTDKNIYHWNEATNEVRIVCPSLSFNELKYNNALTTFNIVVYKDSLAYIQGYDYGLTELNLKLQTKKPITIADGLPSQLLYDLHIDKNNNLWMSSDYGLIRYNIVTKLFKNLTPTDGAQGYEYNSWCYHQTEQGDLIFGGQKGINYFNYKDVTDNIQKPPVIIQKVTKKNTVIPIESSAYDSTIEVKYNENVLSFDFVAFNYKNTSQNKYKYKMEGFETDWRESGTRHFTTYTNLPAGNYTFKVIASNNDGLWNTEGAYLKIKVLPAPWVTWWAYSIYFLIGLYFVYLFVHYKQKEQKKKLDEERKNNDLQSARELQNRLLPKTLPKISNLDIAGYLRTSTEVGGDYYDFFQQTDGTLYAICGDATGHGTPSGMLVSITKAGIIALPKIAPNEMLRELNKVVKKVDLGILRMSLNIAYINGNQLTLSSAGMPPYYIYRSAVNATEEIMLSGLPLGSFKDIQYDQLDTSFNSGDILVIISDGLAEAPNANAELFDYPKVKSIIQENNSLTAQALIDLLMLEADLWLAGMHNPDDITIVAIKHK